MSSMKTKLVFVLVIIIFVLMSKEVLGKVILCSRFPFAWKEAMQKCYMHNGIPIRAPRHTEGPLPPYELKTGIRGWTGDYTLNSSQGEDRCGYLHIDKYLIPSEGVQFDDCDQPKHYICCYPNKDGPCAVNDYHVYTGPWYDATRCAISVTIEDLITIQATPGDYWTKETDGPNWSSINGPNLPVDQLYSCGTVRGSLDQFRQPEFEDCKGPFTVLCMFDTLPVTFDFTSTCSDGNPVVHVSTSSSTATSSTTSSTKTVTMSTMHSTQSAIMNDTVQTVTDPVIPANGATAENAAALVTSDQRDMIQENDVKKYNEVTIVLATVFGVICIGCALAIGIFTYRRTRAARQQDAFSVEYKNGKGSSNVCIHNATRGHTNAGYATGSMHTDDMYEELPVDKEHNVFVNDPNMSHFQAHDKVAHKQCFHHLSAVADIQVYALPKKMNGTRIENKSDDADNAYLEPNRSNHNFAHNVEQKEDSDEESFVDDFSSDESDFDGQAYYTNEESKQNAPTSTADDSVPDCYYNETGLYQDLEGEHVFDAESVKEQDPCVINDNRQFKITLHEDSEVDIYEEYSCA